MARKPMVTRTIVSTKVKVLCMDLVEGKPEHIEVVVARVQNDDRALLKKLAKAFDTPERKVVAIVEKEELETLYGIEEDEFINVAKVLDKETRKPLV